VGYAVASRRVFGRGAYKAWVPSGFTAPPPAELTYPEEVLADSPVGYWRLGESSGVTAVSETGANNGSYFNAPTLGEPSLLSSDAGNTSVLFNGTNEVVSINDSASLDVADVFTIEFLVKRNRDATAENICGKGSGCPQVAFDVDNTLSLKRLGFATVVNSTVAITNDGVAYHVAITKDGATVKIWIDGVDRTGAVTNQTMTNNSSALQIAAANTAGFFGGWIDEFAIYPTALSAGRIAAHVAAANG
jgi:hypothetical protein